MIQRGSRLTEIFYTGARALGTFKVWILSLFIPIFFNTNRREFYQLIQMSGSVPCKFERIMHKLQYPFGGLNVILHYAELAWILFELKWRIVAGNYFCYCISYPGFQNLRTMEGDVHL